MKSEVGADAFASNGLEFMDLIGEDTMPANVVVEWGEAGGVFAEVNSERRSAAVGDSLEPRAARNIRN